MKVKEESEKAGLKLNFQKNEDYGIRFHHILQIDGKIMETVTDFIFLGSKITANGDCSHGIKRQPWKKSYDQLSILKSKDIILPTKVHLVKAMVFSLIMY